MTNSKIRLANVPYNNIEIGLNVVSFSGTTGQVSAKISKEERPNSNNDNWVVVEWENGIQSCLLHEHYCYVTVKEK